MPRLPFLPPLQRLCSRRTLCLSAVVGSVQRSFSTFSPLRCFVFAHTRGLFAAQGPQNISSAAASTTKAGRRKAQEPEAAPAAPAATPPPVAAAKESGALAASSSDATTPDTKKMVGPTEKFTRNISEMFIDSSIPVDETPSFAFVNDPSLSAYAKITVPKKRLKLRELDALYKPSELEEVERLLHFPDIIDYDLHTMQTIPDTMVESVMARRILIRFSGSDATLTLQRDISTIESGYRARIPGNAIYVRIVHPRDIEDASRASSGTHTARAKPNEAHAAQLKEVRNGIERVLRRYVRRLLEPFPNEFAIDVTYYGTFLSLLRVGRRNLEQFLKDVGDYIERRPVQKEGVPGGPPPAKDLEAVPPDVIAAEIARIIRRDVLLRHASPTGGKESNRTSHDMFRVCIGVATTPVLAKIACDAEVNAVMRRVQLEHNRRTGTPGPHQQPKGAAESNGAEVPLVSIRSFYGQVRTLKDTRDLMQGFPVSHVPTLTPAFADMLRRVFDIRTCHDIFKHRFVLHFCLSPKAFDACYSAAYGTMTFPGEDQSYLFSPDVLNLACAPVRVLASNAISLVDAERTKFVNSFTRIKKESFSASVGAQGLTRVQFGRLTTNEELCAAVKAKMKARYREMYRGGFTPDGYRVFFLNPTGTTFSMYLDCKGCSTWDEVWTTLEPQIALVFEYRFSPDAALDIDYNVVCVSPLHVRLIPMIPPAMLAEAHELRDAYMDMKSRAMKCKWMNAEMRRTRQLIISQLDASNLTTDLAKQEVTAKKESANGNAESSSDGGDEHPQAGAAEAEVPVADVVVV